MIINYNKIITSSVMRMTPDKNVACHDDSRRWCVYTEKATILQQAKVCETRG